LDQHTKCLFRDESGYFTNFMNHPSIGAMIITALYTPETQESPLLASYPYEIFQVAAMNLYKTCLFCGFMLNMNGTPTEVTLFALSEELKTQGFITISLSGHRLNYVPVNAFKFFDTYFGTHTLDLSETFIDVHQLNGAKLQNTEAIVLSYNELTKFPPLFNFPRLKLVDLSYNSIKNIDSSNYMNEETGSYERLSSTLEYVGFFYNPVQSLNMDLTEVFSPYTSVFLAGRSVSMTRRDILRKLTNTCVKVLEDN